MAATGLSSTKRPSGSAASATSRFRRDIEGLRAVAVAMVVFYHVGLVKLLDIGGVSLGFNGGFAGVDVFFVISGFLITSLLLREGYRTGKISLAGFYARRARRLLPAATLLLLVTTVAGWLILPRNRMPELTQDTIASTLYFMNWNLAWREVDYLAEDVGPSPLQHYWSLSVEEQYYIFWPLLLMAVLAVARGSRKRFARLAFVSLLTVFAASLGYSAWHLIGNDPASYFYTTTRVWQLAAGALTALLATKASRLPKWAAELLSGSGLLLLVVTCLAFDTTTTWPGVAAVVPTLGTALVIAAGTATQDTLASRFLSIRPMVFIGGLSYAIYLWHWPLINYTLVLNPEAGLKMLLAVSSLSVGAAWLSKKLLEDPIRFNSTLVAKPRKALAVAAFMMAATLCLALSIRIGTAPAERPEASEVTGRGALSLIADVVDIPWQVTTAPEQVFTAAGTLQPPSFAAPLDVPAFYQDHCQVREGDSNLKRHCSYGDKSSSRVIALVGDSKAGQWFTALDHIARQENQRLDLYLKSACPFSYTTPAEPECAEFVRKTVAEFASPERRPDLIIVSSGTIRPGEVETGLRQALADTAALGIAIAIISNNQYPSTAPVYECLVQHPDDFSSCQFPRQDPISNQVLQDVATDGGYPFIDLAKWICPAATGELCPVAIDGIGIYRQGSHITDTYARTMTPILYRELSSVGLVRTPIGSIDETEVP